jgi:hypothetical protein
MRLICSPKVVCADLQFIWENAKPTIFLLYHQLMLYFPSTLVLLLCKDTIVYIIITIILILDFMRQNVLEPSGGHHPDRHSGEGTHQLEPQAQQDCA